MSVRMTMTHTGPIGWEPSRRDDAPGTAEDRAGAPAVPGGRTDWAALYREHAPRLASLALLHTDSRSDAEELLQETLCGLIARRVSADDPMAYLATSLRNTATTWARRRGAARRALDLRAETLRSGAGGPGSGREPDGGARDGSIEALLRAVDRLRDVQRDVLLLKTRVGLTFAQIAIVLDLPANTVASHHRRALEMLREILAEESNGHDA